MEVVELLREGEIDPLAGGNGLCASSVDGKECGLQHLHVRWLDPHHRDGPEIGLGLWVDDRLSQEQLTVLNVGFRRTWLGDAEENALSYIGSVAIQVSCSRTLEAKNFECVACTYFNDPGTGGDFDLVGSGGVPAAWDLDIADGAVDKILLVPQVFRIVPGQINDPFCELIDGSILIVDVECKLLFESLGVKVGWHGDEGVNFVSQWWERRGRGLVVVDGIGWIILAEIDDGN